MTLAEEARRAASLLTDHAMARILVRGADPDAVAAGVLVAHALDREGVHFHLTFVDELSEPVAERLREERNDVLVLAGLSPGGMGLSASGLAENVVVLERDEAPGAGDGPVLSPDRARLVSGVEASAGTFAQVLADHLSRKNSDLAVLALAGSMADLQHAGGWKGLNAEILSNAVEKGAVERSPGFGLGGSSVLEALSQCTMPYLPGLTGRARGVKRFLDRLRVDADAAPGGLARRDRVRLASGLALHLVEHGAPDAALDLLFPPRVSPTEGPLAMEEAGALANRFVAAACEGAASAAASSVWGEREAADRVAKVEAAHSDHLLAALTRVERELAGAADGPFHRVEVENARMAGRVARLAGLGLLPAHRPVVAVAASGGGAVVEGWGHRALLKRGLNLGASFGRAAAEAGGRASGGRVAARARVKDRQAFLGALARDLESLEAEDA